MSDGKLGSRNIPEKPLTQTVLVTGLRRLGLERGMAVEVHSSLSRLGFVQGGAETVVRALIEVVGKEGAIVMSAYPVTLPLPLTEAEESRGIIAKVRFLDKNSECRTGMGAVADAFRKCPDTRLGEGFHRVCAWGRDAELHSQGYSYLLSIDGWVLLIGVDIHRCSSMHQAEGRITMPREIAEYSRLPDDLQRQYPADQWYIQYNDPPEDAWGKVQSEAERRGLIRRGRLGQADCMLFKARPVVGIYEEFLRADPFGLFGIQRAD